jgi:hypothetical protein
LHVGGNGGSRGNLSHGGGLRLIVGKKYEIEVDRGFDPHVLWQLIYTLMEIDHRSLSWLLEGMDLYRVKAHGRLSFATLL